MIAYRSWILLIFLAFSFVSCTISGKDRFLSHFTGENWGEAFTGHVSSWETQLAPEMVSLILIPLLHEQDSRLQDKYDEHHIISPNTGVDLANGIAAVPFAFAAWDLFFGDDEGAMLETAIEANLLNEFVIHTIKQARARLRPDGSTSKSFPSGAAGEAFMGATLAARWLDDQGDSWYYKLGYALYIPAIMVGRSRIDHGKHYPSDIAAGAFLGMTFANTFYNLHFGDKESGKGGVFPRSWSDRMTLMPLVTEDGGVGMALSFRF